MNENQGKRPDQIEFSAMMVGIGFIGISIIIILLKACN